MHELSDLIVGSIDGRAVRLASVSAPAGLLALTRRRRRTVTVGLVASVTVVAFGVSAGAVTLAQGTDATTVQPASATGSATTPSGGASPSPSVEPTKPEGAPIVELPMNADYSLRAFDALEDWCGQPAPEPLTSDQGFQQTVTPALSSHDLDDPLLRAQATLTYTGDPGTGVYANPAQGLIVKDGIVVAQLDYLSATMSDLRPRQTGTNWNGTVRIGDARVCDSAGQGARLPAGDYELVVLSHAWVTEADVAMEALEERGMYVGDSSDGTLTPGSLTCEALIRAATDGTAPAGYPVQCSTAETDRDIIDTTRGIVILIYDAEQYSGDVDVLLVSAPMPFTIDG